MKQEPSDKLYGMPIWDLYACEICGAALFKNTVALHEQYHQKSQTEAPPIPPRIKPCPVCKIDLVIPINRDGSMELDDYDDHLESHNA